MSSHSTSGKIMQDPVSNDLLSKLDGVDKARRFWLRISGFVCIVILAIAFEWEFIEHHRLLWLIYVSGITLASVWWYWVMKSIRVLVKIRQDEIILLSEIRKNMKDLATDMIRP
jgi:O-antigen/teichoic acid export membrane protein